MSVRLITAAEARERIANRAEVTNGVDAEIDMINKYINKSIENGYSDLTWKSRRYHETICDAVAARVRDAGYTVTVTRADGIATYYIVW